MIGVNFKTLTKLSAAPDSNSRIVGTRASSPSASVRIHSGGATTGGYPEGRTFQFSGSPSGLSGRKQRISAASYGDLRMMAFFPAMASFRLKAPFRPMMWYWICVIACLSVPVYALQDEPVADQQVIVVVGADGADEFSDQFSEWVDVWRETAKHTGLSVIGTDEPNPDADDRTRLQAAIAELQSAAASGEVWIVLIGHGTYDGKRAKFNLRGPDVESTELAEWLRPLSQRVIVINCASSSSPFINAISGPNRIVVTSTKDGSQYNFSRFGKYLASAINDPANDLDKDGQTSLLEAFCSASQSVQGFYDQENRLATEHALIDDNGDGLGTPAEWFDGVRSTRNPKQGIADGLAANQVFLQRRGVDATLTAAQRSRRDELEARLEKLRASRAQMTEDQYLLEIEPILVKLAQLYAEQQLPPENS